MKLKNLDDYLNERLKAEEFLEIKKQVEIEYRTLKALQEDLSHIVLKDVKD